VQLLAKIVKRLQERLFSDPQGAPTLIARLLHDDGWSRWKSYGRVLFWAAITAGSTAASAYLIGNVINAAYVERSFAGLTVVAIAIMVAFGMKGLSTYCQAVDLARIANSISAENQRRVFNKLIKQNLLYFSDKHSSEFTSRIAYGSSAPAHALKILITTFGRDAMTLISLVAVMIIQAPMLSVIGIVVMAPSFMIVRHLVIRVRDIVRNEFSSNARILRSLQETIQGMRVVKALNLEDEMRRRLDEDTRALERAGNKLARVTNRSSPLMESLAGLAVGLIIIYAGYEVFVLNMPPGHTISFVTAFLLAYAPGKRLAQLNVELTAALVGVKILYEILDLPDTTNDECLPDLHVTNGQIRFEKVVFEYKPNVPVLRDISFVAEPGQMIALVGPSGGGKTTIFNLLLRFYDPTSGEILIDGQNLNLVSQTSSRMNVSYVGQDVFLFHDSIKMNIALGRLDANEADIIAAAKAAGAHEFIMKLPAGYETPVGENGFQLSGGQRQRIAVARALIRNAPIILLDEPTASLDNETELHVQRAIRRLAEGRTTVVIAHRLHTIMDADIIHVVEDGAIVESGGHEDLLRLERRYAEFYRLQFAKHFDDDKGKILNGSTPAEMPSASVTSYDLATPDSLSR